MVVDWSICSVLLQCLVNQFLSVRTRSYEMDIPDAFVVLLQSGQYSDGRNPTPTCEDEVVDLIRDISYLSRNSPPAEYPRVLGD